MFERKVKQETEQIKPKEFQKLIADLKSYEISLKSAQQKHKDSKLTEKQEKQIIEAGTITDIRLTEITNIVIAEKKELAYFEFYLDEVQLETLKNSVEENAINDGK